MLYYRKPIKSVRENGSATTQQPAKQGANAVPMGHSEIYSLSVGKEFFYE